MIRTLVVSESAPDFESEELARQLSRGGAGWSAHRLTLPPAGATAAVVRRLASAHDAFEPDVVHAIGPSALLAASAVGCRPIVYSPPPDQPRKRFRRLRWISLFRQVRIVVNSIEAAEELAWARPGDVIVLPPIPPAEAGGRLDRRSLGLSPDDRILLACGESTRRAHHEHLTHIAAIAWFVDRRHRLLLWGRGPAIDRVRRFARSLNLPDFFVVAEDQLGQPVAWPALASVADLVLHGAGAASSVLPRIICRHLGVNVLDASEKTPRAAAQEVLRWFESGRPPIAPPASAGSTPQDWRALYHDAVIGRSRAMVTV